MAKFIAQLIAKPLYEFHVEFSWFSIDLSPNCQLKDFEYFEETLNCAIPVVGDFGCN